MSSLAPNRLALALNYVTSAYRFATQKAAPSRKTVFYEALSKIAERDQYQKEDRDLSETYKLAICSVAFYSSVKLISSRMSSREARPTVKRRKGESLVDVKNHDFEILWERPNALMSPDFQMGYNLLWFFLNGSAYWFIGTGSPYEGPIEELWPLDAAAMRPLPGTLHRSRLTGHPCINYGYTINGKEYVMPGEHIVHVRNPNPFNIWGGLSAISSIFQELKTDRSQGNFLERHYSRDNGVPTAIISLPVETSQEQFEELYESIKRQLDEGKLRLITRAGEVSVQTIMHTLQQSDFVNSRMFNIKLIRQGIGIPDGMLDGGLSGDSRLATEITFTRNTVQPLLDLFAAEFTANLMPFYPGGDDLVIVAPSVIPQDRTLAVTEYTTYSQDRSIQENRAVLGMPPVEETGIEILDQMLRLPTRLHPYISSNAYAGGDVEYDPSDPNPDGMNEEGLPGVGDANGLMSPENQEILYTGKASYNPVRAAVVHELKQWRKVALREVKNGRKPLNRNFSAKAIPPQTQLNIIWGLINEDTEEGVDLVFGRYIGV